MLFQPRLLFFAGFDFAIVLLPLRVQKLVSPAQLFGKASTAARLTFTFDSAMLFIALIAGLSRFWVFSCGHCM